MTVGELRGKYLEVFGEETRSYHKEFLRKRIAWRIQSLAEGGLSERARRRAEELANDADLRTRAPRDPVASGPAEVKARTATGRMSPSRDPRLPLPGTLLAREFQGRDVVVKVLDNGFEFDGHRFRPRIPRRRAGGGKGLEGASDPAHEPRGVPARGPGRVLGGTLRVRRTGEKGGGTMTDTPMNPAEPSNANTSGMLRLFVYGILKRGFWNHDRFCRGVLTVEDVVVRGRLFETPSGIPVLQVPEKMPPAEIVLGTASFYCMIYHLLGRVI